MNCSALGNITQLARGKSFRQANRCSFATATRQLHRQKDIGNWPSFGGRLSNHLSAGSRLKTSASGQNDERFQPARTEEEWLQLDEKVNEYPCHRTFKAIGTGGKDFAESMITAVERATSRSVDRRIQVIERPSKEGKYTAVSVRSVNIESGKQVLKVFREMKELGGKRLKYII